MYESDPGQRLRVLYSFPHPFGTAGTGSTARNQVAGLEALGHDVTLACTSVAPGVPRPNDTVETMVVGGRRIPNRLVGAERAWGWHDRSVARMLRQRAREFDVVHAWPLASARTLAEARSQGVVGAREAPNTHTAHAYEVVRRECENLGFEPPRGHSHQPNERRLRKELREYGLANRILVPSVYAAQTFLEQGVPSDRLRVHQYGSDPSRFFPVEARGDRPFTVIFVGRCEPRKGLHHALRAWRASEVGLDGGRFIVCGTFMRGYRELLQRLLDSPGVACAGFTDDVPHLMRSADALVLSSVEEGSALVSYEAMASGCAPLVSQAVGARCEHHVSGLIHEPGDWQTLATHIRLLADDERTRTDLQVGAAKRGAELTWIRAAEVTADCYTNDATDVG